METASIYDLPENAETAQFTVEFGSSIAVSGTRVAIGARESNDETGRGFVTIYRTDTNPWTAEEESLQANGGAVNDQFGYHVAIDDDVLVVGAPFRASNFEPRSGAAYISNRTGSSWSAPVILVSPNVQSFANFGHSVAVAGDLIAVGAPFENSGASAAGAVHVFRFDSFTSSWNHVRELTAPTAIADDTFGYAIALEGTTLVVGAPRRNLNATDAGAVFVYDLSDSTPSNWSLTATLQNPSPDSGQRLGYSVAILDDLIVAGAPTDPNGNPGSPCAPSSHSSIPFGAVHAFRHNGSNWGHEQRIALPAFICPITLRFGTSVAVSEDRILVGGDDDWSSTPRPTAYLYGKADSGWAMMRTFDPGPEHDPLSDHFGFALGFVTPDQPIVGAPAWVDPESLVAGRVYAFDVPFLDCNDNGIDDCLEIAAGDAQDCNGNGIPDECDLVSQNGQPPHSQDANENCIPDECEIVLNCGTTDLTDCNNNGMPDACERSSMYDLIFLIDQSGSLDNTAFTLQKNAIKAVVCGFGGFGPHIDETSPIRIAVIGYHYFEPCSQWTHISLTVVNTSGGGSGFATPEEFCDLIDDIDFLNGQVIGTNVSHALLCATEEFEAASDPFRRQVIILGDMEFNGFDYPGALQYAEDLRTLAIPGVPGLDAGIALVGSVSNCQSSDPSGFHMNLVNHLSAVNYDPSQPRGLYECGTDLAGLYAGMQRVIIQHLLRCPGASEDIDFCNTPWKRDCNGNGIPDCIDILTRFSLDLNGNDVPDECEDGSLGPCPADLTGDFGVSIEDLLLLLAAWGPCDPGACPADLNGDGEVNLADLLILLGSWGACYPGEVIEPCTLEAVARYEVLPPQSIADCFARYGSDTQELIKCIEAMAIAGTL